MSVILFTTMPIFAADPPKFETEVFQAGAFVYPDDFDDEFNKERWAAPEENKLVKDGKLNMTEEDFQRAAAGDVETVTTKKPCQRAQSGDASNETNNENVGLMAAPVGAVAEDILQQPNAKALPSDATHCMSNSSPRRSLSEPRLR